MVEKRAFVLLVVGLAAACTAPGPAPAPGAGATPHPETRRRGPQAATHPDASLDLQAMLSPVPEYDGRGRNLFAFGAAHNPVQPPPQEPVPPPPVAAAQPYHPEPRPAPLAAGPRLNLKYAGFLVKTGDDGAKAKYAIFLDGTEIFAGAVGEKVANRFTVVEIGLESVTVSPEGSQTTQRIPLHSN